MALIKKDNFEWVLEKCTELGVSRFVPIMAERSEKKNIDIERAKRIIKEACEQCGRGDLPELLEIKNLDEILSEENLITFDGDGEKLQSRKFSEVLGFPDVAYDATSGQTIRKLPALSLLIGPEGGWSDRELAKFKEKNMPIYSLGNLTLRAETAAIVAAALLL
jgi:16S rRNA (uracil1498-N3)-methyltransferase